MKIGIIGAGMMGSSLFYACKNIHEAILIAKESMHLAVEHGRTRALRIYRWSYVNHSKTHPNKDENEVKSLKEKGISAHTNYRKDSRQCFTIQACISIVMIPLTYLVRHLPTSTSDRLSDKFLFLQTCIFNF